MSTRNWSCYKCQLSDNEANFGCERCKKKQRIVADLKDLQKDDEPIDPFLFQIMDELDVNINTSNSNNDNNKKEKEEKKQNENNMKNELTYYNDSKYVSLLADEDSQFMCIKGHSMEVIDKCLERSHCIMCNNINGGNENIKKKPNQNEILTFLNEYINKNKIQFGQRKDQKGAEQWFKKQKFNTKYELHYAALKGNVKQINILLNNIFIYKNAKINEWHDMTPIMVAARQDQLLSLIELIKSGIDPLPPPNKSNATPYSLAVKQYNKSIINFYNEYVKFIYGFEANNSSHIQCLFCYQFDAHYNKNAMNYGMNKYAYCMDCSKKNVKKIKMKMKNNLIIQKRIRNMLQFNNSISIDTLCEMRDVKALHSLLKEIMCSGFVNCYSLWLIDIDFFKNINSYLTHAGADIKLQAVGNVLKTFEEKTKDYWEANEVEIYRLWTFRQGGDEFAIVVHHSTLSEKIKTHDKFYSLLQNQINQIELGKEIKVKTGQIIKNISVSIGVCIGTGMSGNNYENMLKKADEAAERVKNAGRNGIKIYYPFYKKWYSSFNDIKHV